VIDSPKPVPSPTGFVVKNAENICPYSINEINRRIMAIKILSVDDEQDLEALLTQYFRRKIRKGEMSSHPSPAY